MEKSVKWEFDTYMQELFQMKEVDIKEYSPLTLAYIGDSIYDLIIKSLVVNEAEYPSLHFIRQDSFAGIHR